MKKWRSRTNTMAEFKIVEIVGRRMREGKEECQVQWAVTWEPVDEDFRKGELYKEFMADLEKEARESDAKDADEGGSASSEEKENDAQKIKGTKADNQGSNFCPQFLTDRWKTGAEGVGAKRPGEEAQRRPRCKNT